MTRPEGDSLFDGEMGGIPITEAVLPSNASHIYDAARSLLVVQNNHGLIVMIGDQPVPGDPKIAVQQMVLVGNSEAGVGIPIKPALAAALHQARKINPASVVLGYGTVAAYEDDAVNAFSSGMRLHLVGGDEFHPQRGMRRFVDMSLLQRPSFSLYTPDAAGRPVRVPHIIFPRAI